MDSPDFQKAKLSIMTDAVERELATTVWSIEAHLEEAYKRLDSYYRPRIEASKTKQEALDLLARVPDTVDKAFYLDYIHFQRKWDS